MRYSRVVFGLGLAATAALLGACGRSSSSGGAVLRATGDVEVAGVPVSSGLPVHLRTGDLINVRAGRATITLPNGAHLELRDASIARFDSTPTLVNGDLLTDSADETQRISTTIADVTVHGVARLHRDLAITVGTYSGTATIAAARDVVVPALEQDTAASVSLVPAPGPLHLDSSDAWDQRYMATAIDLTRQIESESAFVNANAPKDAAMSVAFYTHALRELAATPLFNDALLRATAGNSVVPPAGDQVMAAAIALSGRGDFAARWKTVFALRDAGAQWGIIVLDESSDSHQVLTLIHQAVASGLLVPQAPPRPAVLASPAPLPTVTPPAAQAIAPVPHAPKPAAKPAQAHPVAQNSSTPPTTAPPSQTPPAPNNGGLLAPVDNVLQILHTLLTPPPTH